MYLVTILAGYSTWADIVKPGNESMTSESGWYIHAEGLVWRSKKTAKVTRRVLR